MCLVRAVVSRCLPCQTVRVRGVWLLRRGFGLSGVSNFGTAARNASMEAMLRESRILLLDEGNVVCWPTLAPQTFSRF